MAYHVIYDKMTSLSESGKATLIIPNPVQQTQDLPNQSCHRKYTQGCWAMLPFPQPPPPPHTHTILECDTLCTRAL